MKIAANAEDAPEPVKEYYETVKGFDDYLALVRTTNVDQKSVIQLSKSCDMVDSHNT